MGLGEEALDRIAALRAGQFVEYGLAEKALYEPTHIFTKELLAAVSAVPRSCQM